MSSFSEWLLKPLNGKSKQKSLDATSEQNKKIKEIFKAHHAKQSKKRYKRKVESPYKEALKTHGALSVEEICMNKELGYGSKVYLLSKKHGYSEWEAKKLLEFASKAQTKEKLSLAKRKIEQKAFELYSKLPVDECRAPISEDVKAFVWRRDGGKCVKCGSQEKLEFDHIIPFSKGGSDTERNLQLLCEKCNRSKSASI